MSSENQWKEGGNNTECSDVSSYSSSNKGNNDDNDDNDSSKTDQKLPATMKSRHLNISSLKFNMGTMTMETNQVEVGKSPTKLPEANVSTYKNPTNPYVMSRLNTTVKKVRNSYVVTSTPMKSKENIKTSVPSRKQYSPTEYFPMLKTPTNSLVECQSPVPDMNYVHSLTASIDFNKPFFPDSTGDTSSNDAFLFYNNFLP
eukprot:15366134-Ditylum_brightwellii.AAC.1